MKNAAVRTHRSDGSVLGLELGSTRIKAAVIGEDFQPIASGQLYLEKRLYGRCLDLRPGRSLDRPACGAGGAGRTGEDLGHGGIRHDARVSGL